MYILEKKKIFEVKTHRPAVVPTLSSLAQSLNKISRRITTLTWKRTNLLCIGGGGGGGIGVHNYMHCCCANQ